MQVEPSDLAAAPPFASVGRLHVLTDFAFQQRFSHADLARAAIAGGADTIQFRQKTGLVRHRLREAREAAAVCRALGVPFLVNDALDIALAVDAQGVHLGQNDFPVAEARRLLGPAAVIGATATTVDEAMRAWQDGASYIGFGPVFATRSKSNPAPVRGLEGLREVCRAVPLPVVAIAGMTVDRARRVLEAGAHGVAVMTAVTTAPDPEDAARGFRRALDEGVGAP
jgi:thiamine-phosphate pyrophosphorylase